jgi:hypothetical protein
VFPTLITVGTASLKKWGITKQTMGLSEKYGWLLGSLTIFKLIIIVFFKIKIVIVKYHNVCMYVMYKICFLRSVTEMAGGFLARSQSLPDVMSGDELRDEGGKVPPVPSDSTTHGRRRPSSPTAKKRA